MLNDVFDAEVDAREQPERPIPSGRISLRLQRPSAGRCLVCGTLVAWFASFTANDWRPGVSRHAARGLHRAVRRRLKRTPLAPLVMGECRMLNVLLGMSLGHWPLTRRPVRGWQWGIGRSLLIAVGIGIYIVGVTIFARTDAHTSSRARLTAGLIVLLAGMTLLAAYPR